MIFVKTGTVRALLRFAAKADVRYYLNGVFFDHAGYAVATDGHRLLAVRVPAFDGDDFIIPNNEAKAALGLNKKAHEMLITRELIGGIKYTPIDGRFPEWRRIVPTETASGKPTFINPDYLLDAMNAWHDMGLSKMVDALPYTMNGDSATVQLCATVPEALMILMPFRTRDPIEEPVDYVAMAKAFLKEPAP